LLTPPFSLCSPPDSWALLPYEMQSLFRMLIQQFLIWLQKGYPITPKYRTIFVELRCGVISRDLAPPVIFIVVSWGAKSVSNGNFQVWIVHQSDCDATDQVCLSHWTEGARAVNRASHGPRLMLEVNLRPIKPRKIQVPEPFRITLNFFATHTQSISSKVWPRGFAGCCTCRFWRKGA